MPQKLPSHSFKWFYEKSQFNEGFIKSYNDNSNDPMLLFYRLKILTIKWYTQNIFFQS